MINIISTITKENKRSKIFAFAYSCIFSLCLSIGYSLNTKGSIISSFTNPLQILCFLCLFAISFVVTLLIWSLLDKQKTLKDTKMLLKKPDILVFFFFLLAYTAFLLSLYPGFFVYDATTVLHFYQRWELTTFHPIFHSLLLPAIVEGVYQLTNSYNLGIATWMFIQILVMSAIGTFLIYELRRKKIPLYFRLLTILFLSCFPTIIMYVLCSASDSLFCMNMLLSSILLLSLFKEPDLFWSSKKRQIFLFISLTLMFLLRKNGIYAFIVFIPFLLFVCRKKLPKILFLALLPIILSTGIITFLETVTNAEKAGFAEAYSTPLQQLSRVYTSHKDELTDEEINLYLQVQDDERWMLYDPKIADEIKEFADMHVVKQNLGDYVSLYAKLFFKYPLDYIDAFLMTTYEQWYPYSIYDCYHGGPYVDCCYFGYMVEEPGSKQPQWERLDMLFEWLSVHSEPHKIPVLHLLLSPAFYLWIFLFSMTYSLRRKWYYNNLAMLFMFLVFLTVLLGPCALVRYVAYLFFAAPLYLSMLFDM